MPPFLFGKVFICNSRIFPKKRLLTMWFWVRIGGMDRLIDPAIAVFLLAK